MKIALASDHGGFALKEAVKKVLSEKGVSCDDLGVHSEESVDYPDYAVRVAELVSQNKVDAGILVCGTGLGMSMVANKFKGVRAAVVTDPFSAQMAKEHNNANILCLGGRVTEPKKAEELVLTWLRADYAGGRHDRRLRKIEEIEEKNLR
ncbi:MAG: ribose 5-phosphate isomerase B [bacterium]|nr:ribose 5-phosphate isomerase B [bacterium]